MFDISEYNREFYGTCAVHIEELSSYSPNYKNWLNLCKTLHHEQYDKSGREYFRHCASVAYIVYELCLGLDETIIDMNTIICTALFHDVLEDVENGREKLVHALKKDSSIRINEIIKSLRILDHSPEVKYRCYINRILDSNNSTSIFVKYADILDHIANLPFIEDGATRTRFEKKYHNLTRIFHEKTCELGSRLI